MGGPNRELQKLDTIRDTKPTETAESCGKFQNQTKEGGVDCEMAILAELGVIKPKDNPTTCLVFDHLA